MTKFPEHLLKGYASFQGGRFKLEQDKYSQLGTEGQNPETMVVACCDSRVAPETLFTCGPGEIFVVRNVANLVPSYSPDNALDATSGAIEYAVQVLKVQHIVVMGHSSCGGIQAALKPLEKPLSEGNHVGQWIEPLTSVADHVRDNNAIQPESKQVALEQQSVQNSLDNLRTFPYLKEKLDNGELQIHGAWFNIATGEVHILDPESGVFNQP